MFTISRVRWTEEDKNRLLDLRDDHPDWPWERIATHFPGRSATGLCKMYSDLTKEERKADQANNGNEATEEKANNDKKSTDNDKKSTDNDKKSTEQMVDQANDGNKATKELANDDEESAEKVADDDQANDGDEATEGVVNQANSQNEGAKTTELTKDNKRSPDIKEEEDIEAPPRKQTKTAHLATTDDNETDSTPSEGSESKERDIKVTMEVTLAANQLPVNFTVRLERN